MANGLSHLPHFRNISAGMNKWDPVHNSIWEVYITLPTLIQSDFNDDAVLLTEQVQSISGLDVLQKTTAAGQQKFMGIDVSYLNPLLDNTYADLTMVFNLNLRNFTDNYVLKLFRAWANISYNMLDGTRGAKVDYIGENMRIAEANRDGNIWRSIIFHNVMLTGCTGLSDLNYTSNDAAQLTCTFRCDYWDDDMA